MHAERPALPHQPVQQQGGVLGDLVVLDEQLLKLIDDQQRCAATVASGSASRNPARSCTPRLAEHIAAALQLGVEPLQHAQAELALALDGDHAGVRQLMRRRRS